MGLIFFLDSPVLSLTELNAHMDLLAAWKAQRPLTTLALFFTSFVLACLIPLPGISIMTIGSGALFGFWVGALVASFATAIGALCSFLLARYLFRQTVRRWLGKHYQTLDEGIETEGPFYLFSMRMIPLFPFFFINLAMSMTSLSATTFYVVTQLGLIGSTLVFVNAGTQLSQITAIEDILSTQILLSFGLLGMLPIAAKKAVLWIQLLRQTRSQEHQGR